MSHSKMRKQFILLIVASFFYSLLANSQTKLYTEIAASYIEHLSTGVGIDINSNHKIGVLFGSNFFANTDEFYSLFLMYENTLERLKMRKVLPQIGCKGGYSIYTNKYYSWDLAVIVPYVGLSHSLNNNISFFTNAGLAISRELSMTRVNLGEMGFYKRFLPEFKIGVVYKIGRHE